MVTKQGKVKGAMVSTRRRMSNSRRPAVRSILASPMTAQSSRPLQEPWPTFRSQLAEFEAALAAASTGID
jgi:hypothetical protein